MDCTRDKDLTKASTSRGDCHQGLPASLRFEGEIEREKIEDGISDFLIVPNGM